MYVSSHGNNSYFHYKLKNKKPNKWQKHKQITKYLIKNILYKDTNIQELIKILIKKSTIKTKLAKS